MTEYKTGPADLPATVRDDREALTEVLAEHHWMAETEPPEGVDPYLWCVCGWRSDDVTEAHWASGEHARLAHAHVAGFVAEHVARATAERDVTLAAVRAALGVYRVEGGVSCAGPKVDAPGCFAADLHARVSRALDAPAAAQPERDGGGTDA